MQKYTIFFSGGTLAGDGHAIGAHINQLIAGLNALNIQAVKLPYITDPQAAQHKLKKLFEIESQQGNTPILHIQLVHPWCQDPYTAEFIETLRFPVVVTCQELRRQGELEDGEKNMREIVAIIRAAKLVIYIDQNELDLAIKLEQQYFPSLTPRLHHSGKVIELVPAGFQPASPPTNKTKDIAHLGMFRINKGHRELISFAQELQQDPDPYMHNIKLHLIGTVGLNQEYVLYEMLEATHGFSRAWLESVSIDKLKHTLSQSPEHRIQYHINITDAEASTIMSNCRYGLFLFPEGATKYGSSIPTAMGHGLVTIVPRGNDTPAEFLSTPIEPGSELSGCCTQGAALVLDINWTPKRAYEVCKTLIHNPKLKTLQNNLISKGLEYEQQRKPHVVASCYHNAYTVAFNSILKSVNSFDVITKKPANEKQCHPFTIFRKQSTDSNWHGKEIIAETEHPSRASAITQALTGEFCRLIMPYYPKNRLLRLQSAKDLTKFFVLSKTITEHADLAANSEQPHDNNQCLLSKSQGLGASCLLALLLCETDFSLKNLIIAPGRIIKIDFDLSWSHARYDKFWGPIAAVDFAITAEDIEQLPLIRSFTPFNWLDIIKLEQRCDQNSWHNRWDNIANNASFRDEVSYTTLKLLLLPLTVIQLLITAENLPSQYTKEGEEFMSCLTQRLQELRSAALKTKTFKHYLQTPKAINDKERIIKEIMQFRTIGKKHLIAITQQNNTINHINDRMKNLQHESLNSESSLALKVGA